jgi:pullulanase
MKASLLRWINDFHVDGIRMDSVENVYNWDFIGEYKETARAAWKQRFSAQGANEGADERFLVVGEELQEPLEILRQKRLDGLWHENFKKYIRAVLLGQGAAGEASFESSVRKAIDCRSFGYKDGSQAIIYLTSHDVEGFRNEWLFIFFKTTAFSMPRSESSSRLPSHGSWHPGDPGGEEFADQHDLFNEKGNVSQGGGKQVDPVNFSRLDQEWRTRIKDYVARLVKFRKGSDALAVNDTDFIHVDFNEGKRVLAWRRGRGGLDKIVVVLANFSDFGTADPFNRSAEYRVHNWPEIDPARKWREITQERDVPLEWAGREPIFPWEAKVYAEI